MLLFYFRKLNREKQNQLNISKTSFNKKKDPDTSKSDVKSKAFQNYKPLNPLQSKI